MAKPKLLRRAIATGGLCLCLLLLSNEGRSEQTPSPACPLLPKQGPTHTVSLYVAKALEVPGVVCIRVINGFTVGIGTKRLALQKWEEGRVWGLWGRGFQDLEPDRPIAGVVFPVGTGFLPGVVDTWRPLSGQPAPPGRYRVCFSYLPPDQEKSQELCSEEFSLP